MSARVPAMPHLEHQPVTTSWHCRHGCGEWPCEIAKDQLVAQYGDPRDMSLAIYMSACFIEAVHALPAYGGADLKTRFLGWLPTPDARQILAAMGMVPQRRCVSWGASTRRSL